MRAPHDLARGTQRMHILAKHAGPALTYVAYSGGTFAELVVAASVLFAFFWIALIPVFGLPKLDTGGESFRCAIAASMIALKRPPQGVVLWRFVHTSSATSACPHESCTCHHSASSGEVAQNGFMFKAALRASVSTGIQPTCDDITFDQIPTINNTVLTQLEAVGAGDCAGLKTLLEFAGMNCDTDLTAALAGLPAQIQAAQIQAAADPGATSALALPSDILEALLAFEFPDDITHLMQVCPATCGECGDGGSTSGEASEHALQSKP